MAAAETAEAAGTSTAHQVLSGTVVRRRVLGKHLAFITLNLQSTPAAAPMGAAPTETAPGALPATARQQAVATAAVAFLSAELLPPPAPVRLGIFPIVTPQYRSTTLYQAPYHIQ